MIFVTGGTGFLGQELLRQLLAKGEKIRALYRKKSNKQHIIEQFPEVEWCEGDVLDVVKMDELLEGCETVYHVAAVVSFDPRQSDWMMQVNKEGTANIVNICLDKKIKKLVHVSSIAAIGRNPNSNHVHEDTEWTTSHVNSNYSRSKQASEMEVWRGIAEDLDAVIVNPSIILGPINWREGSGKLFIRAWKESKFVTNGGTGFVDVRDVAKVMWQLMESDISGERFILNGANVPYKEFFETVAGHFNKKPPTTIAKPWMSNILWRVEAVRTFFTKKEPLITKETAKIAHETFFYHTEKIEKALNFKFRPIEETLKYTCDAFLKDQKNRK